MPPNRLRGPALTTVTVDDPQVVQYRVYDTLLCKYLNGTFTDEAKALRQLQGVLRSGKYPEDRFEIARFGADGLPINPFAFMDEFTLEPLEVP